MTAGNSEPDLPAERPGPLQRRIGDAERDQAVTYLQEHMAQGRLDRDEFDERLTSALNARTAADIEPLFGDLPEPRPAGLVPQTSFSAPPWSSASAAPATAEPAPTAAAVPASHGYEGMPRVAAMALAAVWPATIVIFFVTDFRLWWIWVVAAMVTWILRSAFRRPDQPGIHGPHDRPPSLDR